MFGLYTFGIFAALGSAVDELALSAAEESHFVMEISLSPPVASSVLHHTWEKDVNISAKWGD